MIIKDGYRKNVGIVVFNRCGKVLLCARKDAVDYPWQFPQGGMEEGETVEDAARRELFEETGIKSVKQVANIAEPLRYDFPSFVNFANTNFKGQEQYWVLYFFDGDDKEINLEVNLQEIEFREYRWEDIMLAPELIVDFKREVYSKVVDFFKPIIGDFLRGNKDGL